MSTCALNHNIYGSLYFCKSIGLHQSATSCPSCIPWNWSWSNASWELLSVSTFIPRSGNYYFPCLCVIISTARFIAKNNKKVFSHAAALKVNLNLDYMLVPADIYSSCCNEIMSFLIIFWTDRIEVNCLSSLSLAKNHLWRYKSNGRHHVWVRLVKLL